MDPLQGFERNEPCWCGSQKKYKACHGWFNPSAPGAPVPSSDDEGIIFISPNTSLHVDGIQLPSGGVPIVDNTGKPAVPPAIRDDAVAALAHAVSSMPSDPPGNDFARRLNAERWDILREFGLDDPASIASQTATLGEAGTREVLNEILGIAVRMTAAVADQGEQGEPDRTVLWVGRRDPERSQPKLCCGPITTSSTTPWRLLLSTPRGRLTPNASATPFNDCTISAGCTIREWSYRFSNQLRRCSPSPTCARSREQASRTNSWLPGRSPRYVWKVRLRERYCFQG